MKKEIKLIVSDLDGTLIDGKLQATKQDLETLEVLKKRGIPVVAATGIEVTSLAD
ncbi:MAG TPA: HAD hydrolase family protein, partial [Firmicutes bacterium]|nr:HAD hydrolase family protein [Bacillota bacterium]